MAWALGLPQQGWFCGSKLRSWHALKVSQKPSWLRDDAEMNLPNSVTPLLETQPEAPLDLGKDPF